MQFRSAHSADLIAPAESNPVASAGHARRAIVGLHPIAFVESAVGRILDRIRTSSTVRTRSRSAPRQIRSSRVPATVGIGPCAANCLRCVLRVARRDLTSGRRNTASGRANFAASRRTASAGTHGSTVQKAVLGENTGPLRGSVEGSAVFSRSRHVGHGNLCEGGAETRLASRSSRDGQ